MKTENLDRATLAAFATTVLLGGLNAIGIRFTVMELPPFWGATMRFVPAALLLFIIAQAFRLPMPRGRSLLGAILFGALGVGLNFGFIYFGLQKVQPGIAQVILGLVPLLTLLFALAQGLEKFRWQALAGALLALAGIGIVFGGQIRANVPFLYLLAVVMGAVCFAESGIIIKKFPQSHPITMNVVAMATGSVILFLMSLIFNETRAIPVQATTWAALAYLVVFGSCVLFILLFFVLKRWTASANSYSFVLLPFVSITASAFLIQESLSLDMLAGAVLVLAGVYFGAIYAPSKRLEAVSPPPLTAELINEPCPEN